MSSLADGQKCSLVTPRLTVQTYVGDLTEESDIDVLVVPVNAHLEQTSGAAGALARAAGPVFQEKSTEWVSGHGTLVMGEAPPVIDVFGSDLSDTVKAIICTVTPNYNSDCLGDDGIAKTKLKNVYRKCFEKADEKVTHAKSIAFAGLGTGQYHVPPEVSASAALEVLSDMFTRRGMANVELIRFVDMQKTVVEAFHQQLKAHCASFTAGKIEYADIHEQEDAMVADSDGDAETDDDSDDENNDTDNDCAICMSAMDNAVAPVKTLTNCNHSFHQQCVDRWFTLNQQNCPTCRVWDAPATGHQPVGGRMTHRVIAVKCPGYTDDTIEISYNIPSGVQTAAHPRPGTQFQGTQRLAYLPNNDEGQLVLRLLVRAFDNRLVFTVGDSVSTGVQNVVVWNDIHHKTSLTGGPQAFGYPDDGYLDRVKNELKAFGITE